MCKQFLAKIKEDPRFVLRLIVEIVIVLFFLYGIYFDTRACKAFVDNNQDIGLRVVQLEKQTEDLKQTPRQIAKIEANIENMSKQLDRIEIYLLKNKNGK